MNSTLGVPAVPDDISLALYRWLNKHFQSGLLFLPDDSPETIGFKPDYTEA